MKIITSRENEKVEIYEHNVFGYFEEVKSMIESMDYIFEEFKTRDNKNAIFYKTPNRLLYKGCIGVVCND